MIQSDAPAVSIVRCEPYDSLEVVRPHVRRALDLVGGLESLIMPGDTVLVKPNLVGAYHYESGATTNPHVVEAVIELVREAKAGRIVIGEGSAVGTRTADAFEACGMNAIAERHRCDIVDFTHDDVLYAVNPAARKMRRIRLPRTFLEANVVINLPVMKTHDALDYSGGLKNMKGLLQTDDKKRFHKWGLAQSLVDLAHIAMPDITLMDSTVAMEGPGPAFGDPVGLGLLLASKDTVALDAVALEIMGFSLDEIEYVRMAGEAGLGCTDLESIEVLGEPVADVRRPFKRNAVSRETLAEYGIELLACDACSGCSNAVASLVTAYGKGGALDLLRDTVLMYGQGVEKLPEERTAGKRVIRIGSCTRGLVGYGHYYPGCPPFLYAMMDDLGLVE